MLQSDFDIYFITESDFNDKKFFFRWHRFTFFTFFAKKVKKKKCIDFVPIHKENGRFIFEKGIYGEKGFW